MNPPPILPPAAPPYINLGTLTLVMGITFLMQASAVAFNSLLVREYRGVRSLFFAALSMALGYFLLLFMPRIGPPIPTVANLAQATGDFLIYLAICGFTEKRAARWLTYVIMPAAYLLLLSNFFVRPPLVRPIYVEQAAASILALASAYTLLRSDLKRCRLGAYLTALPLIGYGLLSLARFIIGLANPAQIAPVPTMTNAIYVLAIYVLSFLWIAGFILMISQRLQSELNDIAMNDVLTRVLNRRAMQGLLNFEMSRITTEQNYFSIVLLDIDRFKHINDTFGHDAGDAALRWVARTMEASVRFQDVVSRWGGEEFMILLPVTQLDEAMTIAERLRMTVEKATITETPYPLQLTFSAGVACSQQYPDVDRLCKAADKALYRAKRTRNQVVSQDDIPVSIKEKSYEGV